jgi:hypothetical protein
MAGSSWVDDRCLSGVRRLAAKDPTARTIATEINTWIKYLGSAYLSIKLVHSPPASESSSGATVRVAWVVRNERQQPRAGPSEMRLTPWQVLMNESTFVQGEDAQKDHYYCEAEHNAALHVPKLGGEERAKRWH